MNVLKSGVNQVQVMTFYMDVIIMSPLKHNLNGRDVQLWLSLFDASIVEGQRFYGNDKGRKS